MAPGSYRAVPVGMLDHDLVAELLLQLFDRRGRITAKLGGRAVGADRVKLHCLLRRIDADEAIEIRQPLVIIIGVARSLYLLAHLIAGEFEWPGAHDVVLVTVDVLVEDLFMV